MSCLDKELKTKIVTHKLWCCHSTKQINWIFTCHKLVPVVPCSSFTDKKKLYITNYMCFPKNIKFVQGSSVNEPHFYCFFFFTNYYFWQSNVFFCMYRCMYLEPNPVTPIFFFFFTTTTFGGPCCNFPSVWGSWPKEHWTPYYS